MELSMIIGVVRESSPGETRVAATPLTVVELRKLGYDVVVDAGAGAGSTFSDQAYVEAGAAVGDALSADIVFARRTPEGRDAGQASCRPVVVVGS